MRSRGGLLLVLFALLALAACEDRPVHAFIAARYNPDDHCLEAPFAVDVVAGPDPGSCPITRCWETPSGEVLVSTTACDAPPDFHDKTADSAGSPCARALDALAEGADCAP
ncbi:MAG: hypothetical protein L6Q76_22860 [Polyangiaceae bacterium]|nr:hypothetical protein [Polyangiaceae bacterium]